MVLFFFVLSATAQASRSAPVTAQSSPSASPLQQITESLLDSYETCKLSLLHTLLDATPRTGFTFEGTPMETLVELSTLTCRDFMVSFKEMPLEISTEMTEEFKTDSVHLCTDRVAATTGQLQKKQTSSTAAFIR